MNIYSDMEYERCLWSQQQNECIKVVHIYNTIGT